MNLYEFATQALGKAYSISALKLARRYTDKKYKVQKKDEMMQIMRDSMVGSVTNIDE